MRGGGWGARASSNVRAGLSTSALARRSHMRMQPLLLANANVWHAVGWNSADVITCANDSPQGRTPGLMLDAMIGLGLVKRRDASAAAPPLYH